MTVRRRIFTFVLILSAVSLIFGGCGGTTGGQPLTFSQLISEADRYNGKTVTIEAFYFGGFEISALSESVGPASSGPWRIVPTGTLIWVAGGITQEIHDKLYRQADAPSGYTEYLGKLKVTGRFESGGRYGHLDAYLFRMTITSAELLEWTPPPSAAAAPPTGTVTPILTTPAPTFYHDEAVAAGERVGSSI